MSDGITISGAKELSERFAKLADNAKNLAPAYGEFGEWLEYEIKTNMAKSVDFDGVGFVPLKPATIAARVSARGGTKTTKKGELTKRAQRVASSVLGIGTRPLIDTGKMISSIRFRPLKHAVKFSAIGYMTLAMTGAADAGIPKRNPTPFIRNGGKWKLHPRAARVLNGMLEKALLK